MKTKTNKFFSNFGFFFFFWAVFDSKIIKKNPPKKKLGKNGEFDLVFDVCVL